MESTAEKLSVLTRRTEPFSPSKHGSQSVCNYHHPPLNISPRNLFPSAPSLPETPILSLSPSPPAPSSSSESVSPNSPPSDPLSHPQPPTLQSAQIVRSNGGQVYPPTFEFPQPASNVLRPTTISASNQQSYHVLPLSPLATLDQHLIHTPYDLVLPPASAFLSLTYPVFTTVDCTWQYVLDRVVNPFPLWSSYAPGSLGDFADVKAIWQAWDEGTYIKDVGRKPALRLIDARWGNLESQETHKRKFPSWRPRNDNKVCVYLILTHGNLTICRPAKYGQIFISLFTALMQESRLDEALMKRSSISKICEARKVWASFTRLCSPGNGNGQQMTLTSFRTDNFTI